MQAFACFGRIKCLNLNIICFFVYHLPKISIATTHSCRDCSAFRLFGLLYRDLYMYVLVPASGTARSGHASFTTLGYDYGQVVGNDGHAGVMHKFRRFEVAYPPPQHVQQGSRKPLVRRGRVRPNNVLEKRKKKKVCVLGKGCGRLAGSSKLKLAQIGERGGTTRGRVLPIPPFDQKRPYDPFPFFFSGNVCVSSAA